jgi:peptidoglycan biosynthesis protein MviN/MurJ (putative lipid II flippase)
VDAYYAAIHVPDILNYLVAGGALSSTFVPLFQEYWQHQREQAAWRLLRRRRQPDAGAGGRPGARL